MIELSKYWDINKILPYNRCFNLINGERSIGKSYTTQKFIVKRAIERGQEFVYIVRTQDEKKKGIFESAFQKVLQNEFGNYNFKFNSEEMFHEYDNEAGEKEIVRLGYCFALTECVKIKKRSFPNVKYLMFDEYMLEANQSISYVNGWNEPDLFLSMYHTIDRENDKVVCFLLGNNTSFYNPYHMHKAFNIPQIKKGELWYNENVLFQWATCTEELKEDKAASKFLRMIEPTKYGQYAAKGDYIDDNTEFIGKKDSSATHYFTFDYNENTFGVWLSRNEGVIYISEKYDPSCKIHFAFSLKDHKENTLLTKDKHNTLLQWLARNFKLGNVKFETMEIKRKTEGAILTLL